jgi:hypothetical protein
VRGRKRHDTEEERHGKKIRRKTDNMRGLPQHRGFEVKEKKNRKVWVERGK